jgi:hypothetical protein
MHGSEHPQTIPLLNHIPNYFSLSSHWPGFHFYTNHNITSMILLTNVEIMRTWADSLDRTWICDSSGNIQTATRSLYTIRLMVFSLHVFMWEMYMGWRNWIGMSWIYVRGECIDWGKQLKRMNARPATRAIMSIWSVLGVYEILVCVHVSDWIGMDRVCVCVCVCIAMNWMISNDRLGVCLWCY